MSNDNQESDVSKSSINTKEVPANGAPSGEQQQQNEPQIQSDAKGIDDGQAGAPSEEPAGTEPADAPVTPVAAAVAEVAALAPAPAPVAAPVAAPVSAAPKNITSAPAAPKPVVKPAATPAKAPAVAKPANAGASGTVVKNTDEPVVAGGGTTPTGVEAADRVLKTVPGAFQTPVLRIMDYVVAMAPKKVISTEDGVRHQVSLFRSLQAVINRNEEHFEALFTAVLRIFEAHKDGAFHDTRIHRFAEHVKLDADERTAFARLINLIKVLGPVKSREVAIKQLNVVDSLRYGVTEEGRRRVLAYFKV